MTGDAAPANEDVTAGEDIYTAPATDAPAASESESEQLAPPPETIEVPAVAEAPPEDPNEGVPEDADLATLRTCLIETRRENKHLRVLNGQMLASFDKLTKHLNMLTESHNKVVGTINGLTTNEQFLNAVTSYVVAKAEEAEGKSSEAHADGIAKALQPKLTVLHDLDALEEITENILQVWWEQVKDQPDTMELYAHCYIEGKWTRILNPDPRQAMFMRACAMKLTSTSIPEKEVVYVVYNPNPEDVGVEGSDTPDQFNQFMDESLNSGAVGEFNAQVSVTREPTPGAVKFEYQQHENGVNVTYTAQEETPAGEWVTVELDAELVNLYVESVKAMGGTVGETWYINHM